MVPWKHSHIIKFWVLTHRFPFCLIPAFWDSNSAPTLRFLSPLTIMGVRTVDIWYLNQSLNQVRFETLQNFGLYHTLNCTKRMKQETANLVTFTEEILNRKLHFFFWLCCLPIQVPLSSNTTTTACRRFPILSFSTHSVYVFIEILAKTKVSFNFSFI